MRTRGRAQGKGKEERQLETTHVHGSLETPNSVTETLAGTGMLFGLCSFNKSRTSPKRYWSLSGAWIPTDGRARSSATSLSLNR